MLRVGPSGYQYDHWREAFYPHALPKHEWLAWYAKHFDSVEMSS